MTDMKKVYNDLIIINLLYFEDFYENLFDLKSICVVDYQELLFE